MNEVNNTLEALIDAYGLPAVLDALGTVCAAKAEHIAVNWQDATLAKTWERDATLLHKLAETVESAYS